jgi:bifunctional non-homologous end joining protein LigD
VAAPLPEHAPPHPRKPPPGPPGYNDVMQNASGHHAVPPYVLRAVPGAPVSTPLHWQELSRVRDAKAYTLKTIFRRLARQQHDPMAALLGVLRERVR